MNANLKTYNFWDTVKDTVTGFNGVVIARCEWLNGCVRILVQPQELKDSRPIEAEWIDVQQLELIENNSKTKIRSARGGPQKKDPKSPVG